MLLALLVGCAPEHPTRPEDCEGLLVVGQAATDCKVEVAIVQFEDDPTAAEAWLQANVDDALQRDFVHLQVTMRVDPSGRYCGLIADEVLKARCEERARRPHLNRGLPPPGAPGAPPPGGPGAAQSGAAPAPSPSAAPAPSPAPADAEGDATPR